MASDTWTGLTGSNLAPAAPAMQPDPPPVQLSDLDLPRSLLLALLARHLLVAGDQTLSSLAGRLAVHPAIVVELVDSLLDAGQLNGNVGADRELRLSLNAAGRSYAQSARSIDGYVGPVPVSTAHYRRIVEANSLLARPVTRVQLHRALAGVVIADDTLDQLGHALNSARPLLVHGPSGSGKTHLCEQLTSVFDGSTLIPYAIAVDDRCVAVFDPVLHDAVDDPSAWYADGAGRDPRLVCCRRPAVLTGAELHDNAFDIQVEASSGVAHAPLSLRANGGTLVIDEFGRQRIAAEELMRRLALPIETGRDWIRLDSASSTEVPFDTRLVLVTNLPLDSLAGDAFRRLVGHRIHVGQVSAEHYLKLWQQACAALAVPFDPALPDHALRSLHEPSGIAPLAVHPTELLNRMVEHARYTGLGAALTSDMLERAWADYFTTPGDGSPLPRPPYRTH